MSGEPIPGDDGPDRELARRWRQSSIEEPSAAIDARIRDAAREASRIARTSARGARWRRFVPLAAAASVALLAVGIIRLMPPEQRGAIPAPEPALRDVAPAAPPAPRRDAETDIAHSQTPEAPSETQPAQQKIERAPAAPEASVRSGETADALARQETLPSPPPAAEPRASNHAHAREAPTTATTATSEGRASGALHSATPSSAIPERAVVAALPSALAARVQQDAAARTGVDPGSIRIVTVDPVASANPSLGCRAAPTSPEVAAEAPAYIVTVDATGTTLRYHTDGRDQLRFCDDQ